MVHLELKATNNMAEYEALMFGLGATLSLGARQLLVKGDSQLIIKQSRANVAVMTRSWLRTCSMFRSWRRILKSWTSTISLVWRMQYLMICQ
jgi:ribonuclease HI